MKPVERLTDLEAQQDSARERACAPRRLISEPQATPGGSRTQPLRLHLANNTFPGKPNQSKLGGGRICRLVSSRLSERSKRAPIFIIRWPGMDT